MHWPISSIKSHHTAPFQNTPEINTTPILIPLSVNNKQSIMASKLCLALLASSLALLLVADASILRTTIAEVEEKNPSRGSCGKQLRAMDLEPCMEWIRYSGGGGRWEMNPMSSQQYKQQCCGMFSGMDEDCMCSALKSTLSDECMSGRGSHYQGQGFCDRRMMEKLMNVPQMCGYMSRPCHFQMLLV
uniref:Bifunctional inhibitor/plant lipid transfer protein/seed storage helical domain-containing protein n=1 Tax=Kalanchoe fedtschenkoi TaxID=63787 RepID=A0A7N0T4H7_KALFE